MKYFKKKVGRITYVCATPTGGLGKCIRVIDYGNDFYLIEQEAYANGFVETIEENEFYDILHKALNSMLETIGGAHAALEINNASKRWNERQTRSPDA